MSRIEKLEADLETQTINEINSLVEVGSWSIDPGFNFEHWNFSHNGVLISTGENKLDVLKRALIWARDDHQEEEQEYEIVDHPKHYGGQGASHEAISVIEEWNLGFHLGNVVKYISRAGKKPDQTTISDLKKAAWYLDRYIKNLEECHVVDSKNRDGDN